MFKLLPWSRDMRDPKRIDRMLELLSEAWHANPDLRLGQLLVAAIKPDRPAPSVFHAEDDRIESGLKELVGERDPAPDPPPSSHGSP